eukprot:CAMPEP_0180416090 /NCGR_PEP_ID=MMETSP1036_2-20121128/286_1 /TAXON_ID=632150 /ORGANISM="Azadinium spinosum, Strain 3D9" /LENGTH=66 /DNA_ID=CAMNT_0022420973 /DNA_START=91 /DNA_END=291 /DNA_ORIENTATION=+
MGMRGPGSRSPTMQAIHAWVCAPPENAKGDRKRLGAYALDAKGTSKAASVAPVCVDWVSNGDMSHF